MSTHNSGDTGHRCTECGWSGGYHDYSKHDTSGSPGLGGSSISKVIFYCFFLLPGLIIGVLCPPLGALIITLGTWLTGV